MPGKPRGESKTTQRREGATRADEHPDHLQEVSKITIEGIWHTTGEIVPGISGENTSWRMGTGRLARSLRLENVTGRRRSCQFGRAVRGRRDQIGSSGAQSPHEAPQGDRSRRHRRGCAHHRAFARAASRVRCSVPVRSGTAPLSASSPTRTMRTSATSRSVAQGRAIRRGADQGAAGRRPGRNGVRRPGPFGAGRARRHPTGGSGPDT